MTLPKGWAEAMLGELVEPRSGKAHPSSRPDARFIGMEHIEAHTMRLLGTVPATEMKSAANVFEAFDVLYGRLRSYLNKVYQPDFGGLCSGEFIALQESEALLGAFLKYRLNAADFVSFASHINTGDRPRVDWDQIKVFRLLLPPRSEQERIVDALDELLSDLDSGVEALMSAKAKLERYRASVLKAAVEGELTAEWRNTHPNTEPASVLLQGILKERRHKWEQEQLRKFAEQGKKPPANWKAKYKEPVAPDTANLPSLPDGWCWSFLGECFEVHVGATPSRQEPRYWGGGIPWVASGEVQFCTISSTRETITELGLNNTSTQINPAGSVLLNMIGEGKTRGKAGILDIDASNNQNCAAIWVPETPIPTKFLYYWLLFRYEETRQLGSGNNQPAMNSEIVKGIPVPLAPLEELEAVVELLEGQLSVLEYLFAEIERLEDSQEALRQSVLRHAFSGSLVAQNPLDEPATELLKRIAAERAERANKPKKTHTRKPAKRRKQLQLA